MKKLSPGVFQVVDQETVSIDVKATGTLSLVRGNSNADGEIPVTAGQPITIKMDKSKAPGGSFIPNARSTDVTLGFTFSNDSGGRYDLTLTGSSGGGGFTDFVEQAGTTLEATTYTFHIV